MLKKCVKYNNNIRGRERERETCNGAHIPRVWLCSCMLHAKDLHISARERERLHYSHSYSYKLIAT